MINSRIDVRLDSRRISRLGVMIFPLVTVRFAIIEKCAVSAS